MHHTFSVSHSLEMAVSMMLEVAEGRWMKTPSWMNNFSQVSVALCLIEEEKRCYAVQLRQTNLVTVQRKAEISSDDKSMPNGISFGGQVKLLISCKMRKYVCTIGAEC